MEATVALHPRIPLYDVLYTRGSSKFWFYDEMGTSSWMGFAVAGYAWGAFLTPKFSASP